MSGWTQGLQDYWKAHCVDNSCKNIPLDVPQKSMLAFIEHIEFLNTTCNYWEERSKSKDREFLLCKHTARVMTQLHDQKCNQIVSLATRIAELETLIFELKEDGERLAALMQSGQDVYGIGGEDGDALELHRQLMKRIEEK